jgi:bacterioferritin-associated ferredoxin
MPRSRRPRARSDSARCARRGLRPRARERRGSSTTGSPHRRSSPLRRASTSRRGHRQGQRHHQLPPRHRAHRQAGHGPFSITGQPNAMGGREVGGLANQLAAHMGFDAAHRPRAALLAARRTWRRAGPQGGRPVRRGSPTAHQGALDHGDQPGRQPARCRRVRAALERLPLVVVSDVDRAETDTVRARRMCCCRPPPGARRTAPSPIPSGASRASAPSCRCPARPGRTGGSSARSRSGWDSATPSPSMPCRPRSSASTRRSPPSRTTARRDFDIGALAHLPDAGYDALAPVAMAAAKGTGGDRTRASSPTAASSPPIAAAAWSPSRPFRRRRRDAAIRSAQHRPHPRPVAHHDLCSCFEVGEQQIARAIRAGANSVRALGETLRCGTNCGSCVPELKGLIAREARVGRTCFNANT